MLLGWWSVPSTGGVVVWPSVSRELSNRGHMRKSWCSGFDVPLLPGTSHGAVWRWQGVLPWRDKTEFSWRASPWGEFQQTRTQLSSAAYNHSDHAGVLKLPSPFTLPSSTWPWAVSSGNTIIHEPLPLQGREYIPPPFAIATPMEMGTNWPRERKPSEGELL